MRSKTQQERQLALPACVVDGHGVDPRISERMYLVSWWFYPLAVLVIGARQRGLSTILHDCAHGAGGSQ